MILNELLKSVKRYCNTIFGKNQAKNQNQMEINGNFRFKLGFLLLIPINYSLDENLGHFLHILAE